VVLYQLQKKIFYIMKNYTIKSYQNIRKMRESVLQLSKISIPNLLPTSSITTITAKEAMTAAAKKKQQSGFSFFGSSTATSSGDAGDSGKVLNGPNIGNNIGAILSEDDAANLLHGNDSQTLNQVMNELFKLSSSTSKESSVLITDEIEKLLATIPVNTDAYFALLTNFFKALNDDYLNHSGLMRVENDFGEVAYVCPPVRSQSSILSTNSNLAAETLASINQSLANINNSSNNTTNNATGNQYTTPTESIADFNWQYSYKRDNSQFKSSCANEFIQRGKKCLITRLHEY
jgi:hypothetical protein